jgi:hypothetical protein
MVRAPVIAKAFPQPGKSQMYGPIFALGDEQGCIKDKEKTTTDFLGYAFSCAVAT